MRDISARTDLTTGAGHWGGSLSLLRRVSRVEVAAAVAAALILVVLIVVEPDILRAPFASGRAVALTFGGTALAAAVLVGLLVVIAVLTLVNR